MYSRSKISFNAPVTIIFVLCCFIATLLNQMTNGQANINWFTTYHSSFLSPMTYVRFITHTFGHADWDHFIGNISYILILGPMLEEKYKSMHLVFVIILTGFATGIINSIFFPNVRLCGASGVVFAFILLSSFTSFKFGQIPFTFILVAVSYLGKQIYDAVTINDNISQMAHLVGGAVGSIVGYISNAKPRYNF